MSKLYYDSRSRGNIDNLAHNTKALALKWYEYCVENNINILVYETIRTKEQQRKNVASGASQTMNSYHIVGQALDFVPVNSKGETLWGGYGASDILKAVSYAKSIGFEWGGDWQSFVDKPHLQYNYKGYGTDILSGEAPKEEAKTVVVTKPKATGKIATFQAWLNKTYKAGLVVDNIYGKNTKKAALKALQSELNKQYNSRLVIDGIWGNKTKSAIRTVSKGAKGNITRVIQGMLYSLGYDPKGFDSYFYSGCESAIKKFQNDHNLDDDGKAGKLTFTKLFT